MGGVDSTVFSDDVGDGASFWPVWVEGSEAGGFEAQLHSTVGIKIVMTQKVHFIPASQRRSGIYTALTTRQKYYMFEKQRFAS